MKVFIDGVEYIPADPKPNDKSLLAALEVRFDSDAGDNTTVRDYLYSLLSTLWEEGEGFSGKRPFGNSCWDYELYAPLIKHGFISGSLDSDGYLNSVNKSEAREYVSKLIAAAFYGVE